jgi:hypothetical protein
MQSVRDLFEARRASAYPAELSEAAEIGGVALVMLDADIDGLAETYLASDGALRPDQWFTLRQCVVDARTVLPKLTGEPWVHFARLYALAQAMLRTAPDVATR